MFLIVQRGPHRRKRGVLFCETNPNHPGRQFLAIGAESRASALAGAAAPREN